MKTRPVVLLAAAALLFAAGTVIVLTTRGNGSRAEEDFRGQIADKTISAGRLELLDVAYAAASALPIAPHGKNRSRAQHEVVEACLELDQPERALEFTEGISDWRRSLGYAQFAEYCARNEQPAVAERYVSLAERVMKSFEHEETFQDWQKGQIQAAIARTLFRLGEGERARAVESAVVETESSRVLAAEARPMDAEEFDTRLAAAGELLKVGSLDRIQPALETLTELFNRWYSDNERRTLAEETIKSNWKKVPVALAVDIAEKLAKSALDHGDTAEALEQYREGKALVDGARWAPEDHIPVSSRMAALRHRCGEVEAARQDIAACVAMFDEKREAIFDVFRAGALRPVAEAYAALGDRAAALETYRRAVLEGSVNVNARPRAQDLVATCVSMAIHDVEPDAALWARIRDIRAELGDPW